jgi:PAS domain S-box-containing protein
MNSAGRSEPAPEASPGADCLPEALAAAIRAYADGDDPVFVAGADGRIVACNREAARLYGRAREALVGQPYQVILPADRREQAELLWNCCLAGQPVRGVESHREAPDGRTRPVRLTFLRVDGPVGAAAGAVIIVREVSELKEAEARLARMTKVFMDAADPIRIGDLHGLTIDWNREAERVFGWTREEVIGKPGSMALRPEWHALADELRERCLRGEPVRNREAELQTRDGDWIPVLMTASMLTDENEEPVGIAILIKDIRALKQVTQELERKNQELERFAGVIAHDLQQPLANVHGLCQLLCDQQGAPANGEEWIRRDILGSLERMRGLIQSLLNYARLGAFQAPFAPVDCEAALGHALANLQLAAAQSGAIVTHDPLPTVSGDAAQLMQLFQNLVGNAIKYRGTDLPRVHLRAERQADRWRFSVLDNGSGIAAEHRERVFQPFERGHGPRDDAGMGLGLVICARIVERHGGRLWVESEPGRGSVFFFTLPAI